jgi:hypothetical protein
MARTGRRMISEPGETYLGDAVYASIDNGMIKLRTGDGNNQVIYLELSVYAALVEFYNKAMNG